MKVFVVDDDQRIRDALEIGLQLQWQDAKVFTAADGEAGLDVFFNEEPDIVLLDVAMPRVNGFEVELGADDYIGKPYSHLALMARIKAALRRADLPAPVQALPDFEAGELAIHFQNQEVTVQGEVVKLTPVEYKLLYHLVRNAGHLLPHEALLDRVWGSNYEASPEYLKVFVSRLRAKLRRPGGPEYIETERGRGYRFARPHAGANQVKVSVPA